MATATNTTKVSNLIGNTNPYPDARVTDITSNAVIAAAGTTQATATPVTAAINWISNNTAANGVILPVGSAITQVVSLYPQLATNAPKVYPPVGGTINGGSVNASVAITAQVRATFYCYDGTGLNWYN